MKVRNPRRVCWANCRPLESHEISVTGSSRYRPRFRWRELPPAEAMARYRAWIYADEQRDLRREARVLLRGHDLLCTCEEGRPCHADVVLEIANGPPEDGGV
jgi:hypothetical protein